jgi:hypothetical protein
MQIKVGPFLNLSLTSALTCLSFSLSLLNLLGTRSSTLNRAMANGIVISSVLVRLRSTNLRTWNFDYTERLDLPAQPLRTTSAAR